MIEGIEAYPLSWPAGWPRTRSQQKSRFSISFARARDQLMHEIKLMGGRKTVLSTNLPLRRDGLPLANLPQPTDTGVAVYFQYKGRSMSFACDRWRKIEDNIWSICKSIEAIRGIERWGASDMMERAFTGFAALEAPKTTWWQILGVRENCTLEEAKRARNNLAQKHHPDLGGDPEEMARINWAFIEAETAIEARK